MKNTPVKPDDILADSEDFVDLNGVTVRKGSIAAFLKNIDILENPQSTPQEQDAARDMITQLVPAIIASGLYKHAVFKNKIVQDILERHQAGQT